MLNLNNVKVFLTFYRDASLFQIILVFLGMTFLCLKLEKYVVKKTRPGVSEFSVHIYKLRAGMKLEVESVNLFWGENN